MLSKAIDYTVSGWPSQIEIEELKPFFKRRHELSVEQDCLLVGSRVVIPSELYVKVLKLFHEQHIGVVRTKMLIRSYCWWPNINESVEKFIANCETCQKTQDFVSRSSVYSWSSVPSNFYRVHIDFLEKFKFKCLLLVDCKSKCLEVKLMNNGTSAKETIKALKEIFSTFGLPNELVSDNDPLFSSAEFVSFLSSNGIKPTKTPPYHPKSIGAAEKQVHTGHSNGKQINHVANL